MTDYPSLQEAVVHPRTEAAQRFLAAAYDSVEDMIAWFYSASELALDDLAVDAELAARTAESATDMLRASIVFAGAGLDSTIKQLIRDAIPILIETQDSARGAFIKFAEREVDPNRPGSSQTLVRYLTADSPKAGLVSAYIQELTDSSLQSVQKLNLAATALGLTGKSFRQQIGEVDPLFRARNQIVHELDLVEPGRPGSHTRRERTPDAVLSQTFKALYVGQEFVNGVAGLLEPRATPSSR